MKRFLSIWLPRWPIERRYQDGLSETAKTLPLALVLAGQHGLRITATNLPADKAGVSCNLSLADARAICPHLITEEADPDGDKQALRKLALWCSRYSPWTTVQGNDAIGLDITGCAHLFGGEEALLADLSAYLKKFGLTARLAIASTIGAAWALTHYGDGTSACVPHEETLKALRPLPLAALRFEDGIAQKLRQLGFKKVRDLVDQPRTPFVARFGADFIRKLDQASGREAEIFNPLLPAPQFHVEQRLAEPVSQAESIHLLTDNLTRRLSAALEQAGKTARRLTLFLYRVDGKVKTLTIRTSRSHAARVARLFQERLDQLQEDVEAGFGFDVIALHAFDVETAASLQPVLPKSRHGRLAGSASDEMDHLLDRFGNRFGFDKVTRFCAQESHIPEQSVKRTSVLEKTDGPDWAAYFEMLGRKTYLGRPLLLLDPPEPITALAEVPDGPPLRFKWRKASHKVVRSDGPERLSPEWWLSGGSPLTRDYYRIEDENGYRFWVFREGLFGRELETPHWLIHGTFA